MNFRAAKSPFVYRFYHCPSFQSVAIVRAFGLCCGLGVIVVYDESKSKFLAVTRGS